MTFRKNKIVTISIAVFLVASISTSMFLMPTSNAHTPAWQIPTYAFVNAAPNPVGVGQQVLVVMWIDKIPSGALVGNDIRMHNYKLTITDPDGTNQTMNWPTVTDTTSSQYTPYTPTKVGTYTFTFDFPEQQSPTTDAYQNDTYLASRSSTSLTVQEESISELTNSYPLPTEYWTRPIEGQNTYWYTISSNWLGSGSATFNGYQRIQFDGIAPNSAHIMWTKSLEDGGVVGGTNVGVVGQVYASTQEYPVRFANTIIMNGRLIYELPWGNDGTGGGLTAVDLRTGETLWWTNITGIGSPAFGYLFDFESGNQHGVLKNGLIFTSNFARAYDPKTGIATTMNITNVPTGTLAAGPSGEQLRYAINNVGTTANPSMRLTQWNSSNVVGANPDPNVAGLGRLTVSEWYSGTIPANCPLTPGPSGTNNNWNGSMWVNSTVRAAQGYTATVSIPAYDWNVSIQTLNGLSSPSIISAIPGDILFGTSTSWTTGTSSSTNFGTPDPYTFWAISLKPESRGNLLWIKNYTAPSGNLTLEQSAADPISRVFTLYAKETGQFYGYSMTDGSLLWGPTSAISDAGGNSYDYYNFAEPIANANPIYNGKLYYTGYGGLLRCLDIKTGNLLWTYGNGGEGNSTYAGFETTWGHYPTWIGLIADGKIYTLTAEHSPNTPLYKDAPIRCINATNGQEIWTLSAYVAVNKFIAGGMYEADGYLVFLNGYDHQIYTVGKGPSTTTVTAPDLSAQLGQSITLKGTVLDIASGTKQNEQAARFPNGVAAVSDVSQKAWMEYVYMQKPRPIDATGVQVTLSVVDANGNYRDIGTTTTNTDGFFTINWKPDISGAYTVYASFGGSESYWPSHAVTSFSVDPAHPTEAPTATPIQSTIVEQYFVPAVAGIIVAIAIGFAITILVLRKRP